MTTNKKLPAENNPPTLSMAEMPHHSTKVLHEELVTLLAKEVADLKEQMNKLLSYARARGWQLN